MESTKTTGNKSTNNTKKLTNEINNASASLAPKQDLRDDQDHYCWICHKDKINLSCNICPRSYHLKCLNNNSSYSQLESYTLINDKTFIKNNWVCFECELIAKVESDECKSESLRRISKSELCDLLNYAVSSIKKAADITFHSPVNLEIYTDYVDFIVYPMDFLKIEQYIKTKKYCSTEAFLNDCKWILHNCYIFNSPTSPLTINARYMLKIAKNEVYELETCPDCYRNLHTSNAKDFFTQACSYPHNLCLAKLKGHPMWPSKVVKYNSQTKEAEVRFFGAHDKAWVTLDSCILLSEIPTTSKVNKNQRGKLELAIKELEAHIELLNAKFPGLFKFSPPKTTLKPNELYLIPLPDHMTASPPVCHLTNPSSIKDKSLVSETLDTESNSENVAQPPKKQRKIPSTPSAPVARTPTNNKNKQPIKEPEQALNEHDFSSMIDDSDDDNEHKLVIADDTINDDKKRPLNKRKRADSSSSSTKSSAISNASTTKVSVQKRKSSATIEPSVQQIATSKLQAQSPATPAPSKKKLKKGLNDSISSNSSSNYLLPKQLSTFSDNEKVDQLIKQVQYLKEELERSRALHIEEIKEMFENHKSEFRDLKTSLDEERESELIKLRKELEQKRAKQIEELEQKHAKQIEEIKKKSWCTNCLKQACFFCCRLASYCGYECQSAHWASHMTTCLQKAASTVESEQVESEQDDPDQASSDRDEPSASIKNATSEKGDSVKIDNESVRKQTELVSDDQSSIAPSIHKDEKIVPAIEKSAQIKKIKQIIEEKNELNSNKKNEMNEVKEKSEKLVEKKEVDQIKKPIKSTIIDPIVSKCKLNPEKPKDRFLKKLNEKNLLDEAKPQLREPVKTSEPITTEELVKNVPFVKEETKAESKEDVKAESKKDVKVELKEAQQVSSDTSTEPEKKQQVELIKEQIEDEQSSKKEKLTKQVEQPNELVQMRKRLVRRLLDSKKVKEQKETSMKDDDKSKPRDDLKITEASKIQDKKTNADKKVEKNKTEEFEKEISNESSVASSNLKVEKCDSAVKADISLSKNSSNEFQARIVDYEEVDDDSNLMVEILMKNKKEDKNEQKIEVKEGEKSGVVNNEQLINQCDQVDEDLQSPTHDAINQVKEDLISKVVENELKN